MSYHHQHDHTSPIRSQLRQARSPQQFVAVVGTVDPDTEHPITGRSGEHLQFLLAVGADSSFQVDVNTRSEDGSPIQVYIADQDLNAAGTNPDEPFGMPAYGVFPKASLSYEGLGLKDSDFESIDDTRIDSQLSAALEASHFVAVYGMAFDDGGPSGKGVHETHFTGQGNEDGALAIYSIDAQSGKPKRTWFFFKFSTQRV